MTNDRWPRVKALFQAAIEQPVPDRKAFVAARAGEDEDLRREVESLLDSYAADASRLDGLPLAGAAVLAEGANIASQRLWS